MGSRVQVSFENSLKAACISLVDTAPGLVRFEGRVTCLLWQNVGMLTMRIMVYGKSKFSLAHCMSSD